MKSKLFFVITILFSYFQSGYGSALTEYLENRYTLRMVKEMPVGIRHPILIISSRYIKPEQDYAIKKGLHPNLKMFLFIAGIQGDTAFVKPLISLREATHYLPVYRDFLVYVDGHGKNFVQVMERGFEITNRFNLNMVVFDWPTDYIAPRKTAYNADEVTVGFIKAMRDFNDLREESYSSSSVSAIFHSMGNNIIKNATHDRLLEKLPHNLFSNIIINAAAVKQQNHSKWIEKLNIQKRIYITINDDDRTLHGAMILRLAKQLGLGHKGLGAKNAHYVNFSDIGGIEHNLFLGKSQIEKDNNYIFQFYEQVFHGKEVRFAENTGFQIFSPSDNSFLFSLW